jgi:hypothetical protein
MTGPRLIDHALHYADYGWSVFPCRPRAKRPLTEHGFHDATTDADVIASWWAATPWANIGVATEASRLGVLDVDPAGLRRYGRMRLPRTPMAITGRGGYHILFRAPAWRVSSGADKYGKGLDVKAAGAYIVVAPSIHPSGNLYKWHRSPDDVALAKWPFPPPGDPPRRRFEVRPVLEPGRSTPKGDRRLSDYARKVARTPAGSRHDLLFWAACRCGELVACGQVAPDLVTRVLAAAAGECGLVSDDGLELVERTIADGMARGQDDLGGVA